MKQEKLREMLDFLIEWQSEPLNASEWQAIVAVQTAVEDLIAVIDWSIDA